MRRRDFSAGCVGLPLLAQADEARAASGPLTRLIFPFAAGGGDTLCRLLAQHLGQLLDRTVIVENRTGDDGLTALNAPEVKEKLLAIGLIPEGSTPDGLANELAANTALWQPIVKATGYKIEN